MSNTALHALLQPMAITERWLRVLADRALDPKAFDNIVTDSRSMSPDTEEESYTDGVCIVPINGPLSKEPSMWSWLFGGTSYVSIRQEFQEALDSELPIILLINSPGGEVYGVSELADDIHSAREAGHRIHAYIDGQGDSAAYWLASQCDKIIINDVGEAGSIGVRCLVVDDSKAYEKVGITNYDIVAGQSPLKVVDASDPKDRARVKAQMTDFCAVFVDAVARGRGVSTEKVLTDFGQGDVFVGQAAVDAGLADEVGTLESVILGLTAQSNRGNSMAITVNKPIGAAPNTPTASVKSGKCSSCKSEMDDSDQMYCKGCFDDDDDGDDAGAHVVKREVLALTGKSTAKEALGVLTAMKMTAEAASAQASELAALKAEVATIKADKAKADIDALVAGAVAEGRIGKGRSDEMVALAGKIGVDGLKAALAFLPKTAAEQPAPASDEKLQAAAAEHAKTLTPATAHSAAALSPEVEKMLKATGTTVEAFNKQRATIDQYIKTGEVK